MTGWVLPLCERRKPARVPCQGRGMRARVWGTVACGCLALWAAAASGQPSSDPLAWRGQAAWEYRPYQIAVWLTLDHASPRAAAIADELADWLPRRSEAVFGAAWRIEVQRAPSSLSRPMDLEKLPSVTREIFFPARSGGTSKVASDDLEAKDKIFVVQIADLSGVAAVLVREVDVRTRQVGPLVRRTSASRATLPLAVWDALVSGFAPLARVERVDGQEVTARLRAGGLWTSPLATRWMLDVQGASEPQITEEQIGQDVTNRWPGGAAAFSLVLRRNQRDGRPEAGGIQPLAWTLLEVQQQEGALLRCRLHSAFRSALPPRGSARLERLALAVQPVESSTTLTLRSSGDGKPLVGYELYLAPQAEGSREAADLGGSQEVADRSGSQERSQPRLVQVGVTDERGHVVIPGGQGHVTLLLVRHGQQLLARLPLVPGQRGPLMVELSDDDPRLIAEALSQSIMVRSLDVVALREVMAARLRAQVRAGQQEEARQLLEALRRLPSRSDLSRDLERFRQQISSSDRLTQARIDRLFAETQKVLLQRPLSEELVLELARELAAPGR